MKTIKEIKDEIAKVKYDSSFNQAMTFMHKIDFDYFMDAVAKRYAEEAIKECAIRSTATADYYRGRFTGDAIVNQDSILNIIKELK